MAKTRSQEATSFSRGRITARVPQNVNDLIEAAANMVGATVNQFVTSAAIEKAESILEKEFIFRLSPKGMERFLELIDNPPEPSAALVKAVQRYKSRRVVNGGPDSTFEFEPRIR
jgi:uncharacterized protein (DUF1778 family)